MPDTSSRGQSVIAAASDSTADQIHRTLCLFREPGDVVEIRILHIPGRGKPHQAAGYYTDFRKAAADAAAFDENRKPGGIYFTLNSINPALLARSPERITEFQADTTSDRDIVRRQWLLIDIDPDRPKGISSSDEELESARIVGGDVRDWLREECHFFEPVEAMSGNGWHLLYPLDLPNDETATQTAKGILAAVGTQFGGSNTPPGLPSVTVDLAVCNAARITKLYGTMARKGHDIAGRPHRRSELVYVPDYIEQQSRKAALCPANR